MGCWRGVLVLVTAVFGAGCIVVPVRSWGERERTAVGPRRLGRIEVHGQQGARITVERDDTKVRVDASIPRTCVLVQEYEVRQVSRDQFGMWGPCEGDRRRSSDDDEMGDVVVCGLAMIISPITVVPSGLVSSAIAIVRPSNSRVAREVDRAYYYRCDLRAAGVGVVVTPPDGEPVTVTTDLHGTATLTLASVDAARRAIVTPVDPDAAAVVAHGHGQLVGDWGAGIAIEAVTEIATPPPYVRAHFEADGTYWMVVHWPKPLAQLHHAGTFEATSTTLVLRPTSTLMFSRAPARPGDALPSVAWQRLANEVSSFDWTRTQTSPEAPTMLTLHRRSGLRRRPLGGRNLPTEPAEIRLMSEAVLEWPLLSRFDNP